MQKFALDKLKEQWTLEKPLPEEAHFVAAKVLTRRHDPVVLTKAEVDALRQWFLGLGLLEHDLVSTPIFGPGQFNVFEIMEQLHVHLQSAADRAGRKPEVEVSPQSESEFQPVYIQLHPTDFNRLRATYGREGWFSSAKRPGRRNAPPKRPRLG